MNSKILLLSVIFSLSVLAACVGSGEMMWLSPLASPMAMTSPLAQPMAAAIPSMSDLEVVVTETTGAVSGSIAVHFPDGDRPVKDVIVALAELIYREDGQSFAAGYDGGSAPKINIDDQGRFVINEVPPGKYGLILDSVISAYLLGDAETGYSIILDVKAGEHIELGHLTYDSLPILGYSNPSESE